MSSIQLAFKQKGRRLFLSMQTPMYISRFGYLPLARQELASQKLEGILALVDELNKQVDTQTLQAPDDWKDCGDVIALQRGEKLLYICCFQDERQPKPYPTRYYYDLDIFTGMKQDDEAQDGYRAIFEAVADGHGLTLEEMVEQVRIHLGV
jgi:hypothetical protein